jgi:hypothetical protein
MAPAAPVAATASEAQARAFFSIGYFSSEFDDASSGRRHQVKRLKEGDVTAITA